MLRMNKILILYKSSTGFTKRYAEMIAEEVGCKLVDFKAATVEMASAYDMIVFGSRAHAGMIDGYKKAREMSQKAGADQFVLFVTGATPNSEKETIEEFWRQNLTEDEYVKIPHFYMQAGLCYERMSLPDKLMMKVAAIILKRKKDKGQFDKKFEQAISSSYDISSREYIKPLVSFLKK